MRNRIQELRKERKIRQEDLAEAVGVTRQTIIPWKMGNIMPPWCWPTSWPDIFPVPLKTFFYLTRRNSA